jgi:hypothetical protein
MTDRFIPEPGWPSIVELATALWGPPNKRLSKPDDVRWGSRGSKSVKPSTNMWHDHENSTGGGYVDICRMARGSLPMREPKPKHAAPERGPPPGQDIAAIYPYHGDDDGLILQVVRTLSGNPRFRQRRPDGRGGWSWSVKDVPGHDRLLYRLPGLRASGDATVWITEGEKDADRLHGVGLVATTNIGGAGKWRDDYAEAFRGKHCVVLADNDPQATDQKTGKPRFHPDGRPVMPGQDHAATVARSLHGVATSVKVLLLPGLGDKQDVSDWLDAGGTVEELERLAASADASELPPRGDDRAGDQPAFFDPWADPPPPEFPGGVLTREMEDTIFALAIRDGVCPGALAMAYLAAASGAAPKASRFKPYQNSDWLVPPIVWVMTIADSGQRKTAIGDSAFRAIREAHAALWRAHRARLQAWQALPLEERRGTTKPEEPHSLLVEDVTPEKLQMILAATDRGTFMVRDEMAGLFEFGRYAKNTGAAERAFYLQAYEGGHYTVSRVGRDSLHIEVNALTIYGSIQPDRLKDFPDLAKDGMIQRINMVRASPASASRDNVNVKGVDKINAAISGLTHREAQRYRTTPDASNIIRETERDGRSYAAIADYGPGFQGTCSKLHGTHARWALILHLLDNPDSDLIPQATIERAAILVREFLLPQARDFFANLAGSPQQRLREAAGWILTKAPTRFLASDLTTSVWACRGISTKDLAELLDPLVTGGWIEPETPFPNNRAWTIIPHLRTAFADRAETERARREETRQLLRQIGTGGGRAARS